MIGATSLRIVSWLVSPMMRPFPRLNAAVWNAQYRFGIWDYLDNPGDGAQILNLVEEYAPDAKILDLGCGTSANLPLIPGRYRHYHGVDISATAVEGGRALGRPDTSFETADIFTYKPSERYDAILLREVLCYFSTDKAGELLRRLAGFLEADGKIFVQVWQGERSLHTTPNQFADIVRNCGLAVLAERARRTEDGSPGGVFIVLAVSLDPPCKPGLMGGVSTRKCEQADQGM